jgi:hypothetical protein
MFDLDQATVKLASVNARAEKHGEDTKPAYDLKIEASLPSSALIHFHPELRQHLYKKDENPDLVDQVSDGDGLTVLRYPKLGPLKWDWEAIGYCGIVAYGIGDKSDIQLGEDLKIDHFVFDPQNGGTVGVTFRVIAHLKTDDVGKLCEFIQRDIELTLTPPEPKTVQELFGDEAPAKAA